MGEKNFESDQEHVNDVAGRDEPEVEGHIFGPGVAGDSTNVAGGHAGFVAGDVAGDHAGFHAGNPEDVAG